MRTLYSEYFNITTVAVMHCEELVKYLSEHRCTRSLLFFFRQYVLQLTTCAYKSSPLKKQKTLTERRAEKFLLL